jgi:hypothetical protein
MPLQLKARSAVQEQAAKKFVFGAILKPAANIYYGNAGRGEQ